MLCMASFTGRAQSLWTSAEMKFGIAKGLNGSVEGEWRTKDNFSGTDRFAGSAGLSYKFCPYFSIGGGYTYIHKHVDSRTTKKGNIISDYWQPRHRTVFDLTGSYKWGRFSLSLRERYQFTHRVGMSVAKYDGDDGSAKADEIIDAENKHVLRSRLKADYNIRKSGFNPFASVEVYNNLSDFSYKKLRLTAGTDYKINKHNSLTAFYRYISGSDDDDRNGHVIGVGYRFKF